MTRELIAFRSRSSQSLSSQDVLTDDRPQRRAARCWRRPWRQEVADYLAQHVQRRASTRTDIRLVDPQRSRQASVRVQTGIVRAVPGSSVRA